jgi:metal-responsive CopG/Arc/MetJ family transcriptional regulator
MSTKRARVVLPEDLVSQIDQIVGVRGRSAFLVELARREIKRRRLLELFESGEPIWKDADHPEL